jgi:hypothetical protein
MVRPHVQPGTWARYDPLLDIIQSLAGLGETGKMEVMASAGAGERPVVL